jgi:hypothetical protein
MSTYYEIYPGGAVAETLSEARQKASDYVNSTGEDAFVNLVTSVTLFRCTSNDDPREKPVFEELSLSETE